MTALPSRFSSALKSSGGKNTPKAKAKPQSVQLTLSGYQQARNALLQSSKAEATKRALAKNWQQFELWCLEHSCTALPCSVHTLEAYLIALCSAGRKVSTIEQAKWAIDTRHKMEGLSRPGDSEQVRLLLSGIKRKLGVKTKQMAAFDISMIKTIEFVDALGAKRDKLALLLGFAAGLRRSELIGLDFEHIQRQDFGVRLQLIASKGNQYGASEWVDVVKAKDISCCPVFALYDWLECAGITRGAVLRSVKKDGQTLGERLSGTSLAAIVKKYARLLGCDPKDFGAHSLRSGCATFYLKQKVPLHIVAKQLRHKSLDTTLRYDRNQVVSALEDIY